LATLESLPVPPPITLAADFPEDAWQKGVLSIPHHLGWSAYAKKVAKVLAGVSSSISLEPQALEPQERLVTVLAQCRIAVGKGYVAALKSAFLNAIEQLTSSGTMGEAVVKSIIEQLPPPAMGLQTLVVDQLPMLSETDGNAMKDELKCTRDMLDVVRLFMDPHRPPLYTVQSTDARSSLLFEPKPTEGTILEQVENYDSLHKAILESERTAMMGTLRKLFDEWPYKTALVAAIRGLKDSSGEAENKQTKHNKQKKLTHSRGTYTVT
jgi:hypothetical protein